MSLRNEDVQMFVHFLLLYDVLVYALQYVAKMDVFFAISKLRLCRRK